VRRIAVIGLSAFGMALVQALAQERCRILAVDIDEHKVNQVRELADEAVIADVRERSALEALRVADYDAVVLSVGEPLDSSLLAVLHLRDLKVEHIYAKAVTEDHRRLLLKLGVDEAIFPEADMARRVALTLSDPMVLDTVRLGEDFAVVEVAPPKDYVGRTVGEISAKLTDRVAIVAIRDMLRNETRFNPSPDSRISDSDVLIIIGKDEHVRHLGARR
jgi:trk system potassium uptake protein TrkA